MVSAAAVSITARLGRALRISQGEGSELTTEPLADGLLRTQRDGVPLDGRAVMAVQRRRAFPAAVTQRFQQILQNRVIQPALEGTGTPGLPNVVARVPALGRIVSRFVGVGVLPEHVKVPERAPEATAVR